MTRYQKQILELRLNGFSSQEIAEKMEIAYQVFIRNYTE